MKRTFLTVVLVLACGVGGWFARQYAPLLGWTDPGKQTTGAPHDGKRGNGSDASENVGRESVVALGRVEPADGVIDVGGTIGDRLGRLLVEEGSAVKKGDLLAELESRELRKLELDAADCRLHIAEQRLTVEQSLADVKIKSVAKRLKEKRFAANVSRARIRNHEQLGLTFEEFAQISLDAMREIADDLGL